ncbi:MAG: hypothetical protein PW788_04550 [Micavibrio sp.]|nr:hypothetical protein [Micavibrio sp.]
MTGPGIAPNSIAYQSPFPVLLRVALAAFGLFTLWGAYDLVVNAAASGSYLSGTFFFLLLMAFVALAVACAFFYAAVFAALQKLVFNAATQQVTRIWRGLSLKAGRQDIPFNYLRDIEVVTETWSDRPETYSLALHLTDGDSIGFAHWIERKPAYAEAARLRAYVGLPVVE